MSRTIICLLCAVLLTGVMCASTPSASASAAGGSSAAGADGAAVERAVACRGVLDREPVDVTDTFTTAEERAYVFCEISGGGGETVRHVYYHNGAYVTGVDLTVHSDQFRTWSYKSLWPGAVGEWRVDIVTGEDTVLETVTFRVVEPDAGA